MPTHLVTAGRIKTPIQCLAVDEQLFERRRLAHCGLGSGWRFIPSTEVRPAPVPPGPDTLARKVGKREFRTYSTKIFHANFTRTVNL